MPDATQPCTADDCSDVARGYMAQRLIWAVGANAAVVPPTTRRSLPFNTDNGVDAQQSRYPH